VTEILPARFRTDLEAAMVALDELYEAADYDALAWNLVNIGTALRGLRDLHRAVEDALVEIAPWSGGVLEVDGLPLLERKGGADRKAWRWDELRPELRKALLDPERNGGEVLTQEQVAAVDAAMDLLFAVAPLTASSGPRVKELRSLGLQPDEFCEVKAGRVSVQIHGGTE
jgi:hypothetical protein